VANLEENLGALQVRLAPDELAAIEAVFPTQAAAGERYPEGAMRLLRG
jgi:aryl-alcohol dehydrogenase-like predicted oxidoreductase